MRDRRTYHVGENSARALQGPDQPQGTIVPHAIIDFVFAILPILAFTCFFRRAASRVLPSCQERVETERFAVEAGADCRGVLIRGIVAVTREKKKDASFRSKIRRNLTSQ